MPPAPRYTGTSYWSKTPNFYSGAFTAFLKTSSDTEKTHLLNSLCKIIKTLEEDYQKHHAVVLKFSDVWCRVTLELLDGKTLFQSHIIVEQHKSYRMVVESLESIQGDQNLPLFMRGTFLSACEKHAQNRSLRSSWMSPGYKTWTIRK